MGPRLVGFEVRAPSLYMVSDAYCSISGLGSILKANDWDCPVLHCLGWGFRTAGLMRQAPVACGLW